MSSDDSDRALSLETSVPPILSQELSTQAPHMAAPPVSVEHDPLAWPAAQKWIVTAALSISGFNRIIVSTIMAPALPTIASELDLTSTQSLSALSAFVLATAFSPLLAGPLSEVYGRAPVLHITNIWFLAFNIACGFVNTGAGLIASRTLAGFGAGAIYALASGVLGDLWPPEMRGTTISIYLLVPLLGAAVGPIIGGYVEQYTTWRWIFWSTSIVQALTVGICFVCFRETHRQTLESKANNPSSKWKIPAFPRHLLWKSISVPPKQLALYRSVQLQAILSGFGYGILYLLLSTYSSLFTDRYNQSASISGLHYIAICLGEIIGSQIGGRLMDYLGRKAKQMARSDRFEPEYHLPIIFPGAVAAAIGFLLYGWAADRHLHWIIVDLGALILSLGTQMTGQGLQAYNMDTYPDSRASTSAAVQVFRSMGAFALPLAGPKMFASLGYGWSNTLLGLVYLGGQVGATAFLWKKGKGLRGVSELIPLQAL
ncbi:uncharacterized protein IL334_004059 [Kwoniella shivajii]|uniref:Major facilitator superfamily (MFS) profile domain-containing protein n=1 Tax=Kwoniella shivajii TaxID=564305 RepID=A0ABZ1CZW2_9TREE|nr:hypothetical protein IL334_004059 [Kwoniella shivajii]